MRHAVAVLMLAALLAGCNSDKPSCKDQLDDAEADSDQFAAQLSAAREKAQAAKRDADEALLALATGDIQKARDAAQQASDDADEAAKGG